ncbi:hypothetical protein DFJ58DRAFT_825918 [Suillus subalutaceus]|uniref:uncharacterized protein n=1 Tax=Suillus subalutaceus TaxID=48586 RepID=UPI001B86FCAB|nr:uncharacterized protein DFJ58DRAFT_825918 [Suillus subalutaceus]KAG1829227.1 hypothetical protein DFJ58DRAFT_825918 [Suillus subalutaceus]
MASSNIISCTDNVLLQDNIVVMDVENLLAGWPTYEINFTPQNPGPVKLIIWLKDAVKLVHVEDSTDSEAELLLPGNSKGRKRTYSDRKNKKLKTNSNLGVNKIAEGLAALKITSACSSNPAQAKPVRLVGIPKAPVNVPLRRRRFCDDLDAPWPPNRHRTLRDIKNNEEISNFEMFRALPGAVAAEEPSTL